jgi:hypothetical protein
MDLPTTQARCAVHPERLARGTCKRCGNFACAECDASGFESGLTCSECARRSVESRYHVVPVWRFVLLNALTFGIYNLYWFWKNWQLVKRADGSDIWPIPRAIFAGFTYFMLINDINMRLAARTMERKLSVGLAIGYFFVGMLHRLPDPWWVVSAASFLFVLPAVQAIEGLASEAAISKNAGWSTRHTVLLIFAVPFFLLTLVGVMLLPESPQ